MTETNLEKRRAYMRSYMRRRRGTPPERARIRDRDGPVAVHQVNQHPADHSDSVNSSATRRPPHGLRRVERQSSLIGTGVKRFQVAGQRCPNCIGGDPASEWCYADAHPTFVSSE